MFAILYFKIFLADWRDVDVGINAKSGQYIIFFCGGCSMCQKQIKFGS